MIVTRVFLALYIVNAVLLIVTIVLFTLESADGLSSDVNKILGVVVSVVEFCLFIHFALLIVYFFKMGLWYVDMLNNEDENISLAKSKCLFITMSIVLLLTCFNLFISLGFLFINNGWNLGLVKEDDNPLTITWITLQTIETISPLLIGWFNLFIIVYFSRQLADNDTSSHYYESNGKSLL